MPDYFLNNNQPIIDKSPHTVVAFTRFQRTYWVILLFGNDNKQQKIHYEIEMVFSNNDGRNIFYINKKEVYLHDTVPSAIVDRLSAECGKVLYPLQITVSNQGVFTAVYNIEVIKKRWQDKKPSLQQYYNGPVAQSIINSMDKALSDKALVYNALAQDWFYTLFFAPVYHVHKPGHLCNADIRLPFESYNKPVLFNVQQTGVEALTVDGHIEVKVQGNCADPRSLEDILKGYPIPVSKAATGICTVATGMVSLVYKLNPVNLNIFSITGNCKMNLHNGKQKTVTVEVYNLTEKDKTPKPGTRYNIMDDAVIRLIMCQNSQTDLVPELKIFYFINFNI